MTISEQFKNHLTGSLFWDTDRDQLDTEAHAAYIIVRVMERGSREDVRRTWEFYGAEKVKACLLQAPALSPETIAFFSNQFDLPRDAFRAHGRTQNWAV